MAFMYDDSPTQPWQTIAGGANDGWLHPGIVTPKAPQIPDFVPFTQTYDAFTPGSAASKLKGYASGDQESPWLALARQRNGLTDLENRDKVMGQGQAAGTMAADNLAMQGGITSGARERAQTQSSTGIMDRLQDVGRQTSERDLELGIEGGREQMNQLGQVAGMEANQGMFNTNLAQNNNNARNAYNQNRYDTEGQIYGNNQIANALDKKSQESSWVCTEVDKIRKHSAEQKVALKILTNYGLKTCPKLTLLYLRHFKRVIKAMRQQGVDFENFVGLVDRTCRLVLDGKVELAYWAYVIRMQELAHQFHPEFSYKVDHILTSEDF